jgi:hypothetical protein
MITASLTGNLEYLGTNLWRRKERTPILYEVTPYKEYLGIVDLTDIKDGYLYFETKKEVDLFIDGKLIIEEPTPTYLSVYHNNITNKL